MEEHILKRIREYTEAVYQMDFKKLVDQYFYPPDLKEYYDSILWLAEHMEPFGESDNFLNLFPRIDSVEELKAMPLVDFIASFLSKGIQEVGQEKMKAMMESMQITNMEKQGEVVLVEYILENVFDPEGGKIHSNLEVIEVEGEWYFKFRASMSGVMNLFKGRIEDFNEKVKKDNLKLAKESTDLEVFPIYGYRNLEDQTVIEPRYKDAGDFCEGLAYAQVFSKYGYINKYGKFIIRPRFDKAFDFSPDGLAKVGKYNEDDECYYGFINKEGIEIVPFTYTQANHFSEGMAAVKLHGKWGFINAEGRVIIEMAYDTVYDFEDGEARLIKEMGNAYKEFVVDRDGNVTESFEQGYDLD